MGYIAASDGKRIVSTWPTMGSRKTVISHRWNDPTTWIRESVSKVEQICSVTVAGTSYLAPDTFIIDVYHGKVWDEDDSHPGLRVLVEVNISGDWVEKTEKDPHDGVGDYTLNYTTGVITFSPAIDVSASVRSSYHASAGSEFLLKPSVGKKLSIKSAEVQFSSDTDMTDTVIFQTYGYVDVFAPYLLTTADPPGPFPPGTLIPIQKTVYKSLYQFIDESNGANPEIPAIGGSSWRGATMATTVFPWNYAAALPLMESAGMEVRIFLEHDDEFGGSYSTATFYALSEDDI